MVAFSLIDGSNANVSAVVAGFEHKCWASYFSADLVRDFTERTTFCTGGGWRSRQPGLKQLLGTIDGFLAQGLTSPNTAVNPGAYFASTAAQAYVLTMDLNCSYTFNGHAGRHHAGIRAALNSEMSLNFESDGQVTIAWVVA